MPIKLLPEIFNGRLVSFLQYVESVSRRSCPSLNLNYSKLKSFLKTLTLTTFELFQQ